MLPDFASMVSGRIVDLGDEALRRGARWHAEIDRAFHALPAFREWCALEATRLRAAGLQRGPARAAAHVMVELVIDGELARDVEAGRAFEGALREGPRLGHAAPSWRSRGEASRWAALRRRLLSAGPPVRHRDPRCVAASARWSLGRRPRLALDARGEAAVDEVAPALLRAVAPEVPGLLDDLREALG